MYSHKRIIDIIGDIGYVLGFRQDIGVLVSQRGFGRIQLLADRYRETVTLIGIARNVPKAVSSDHLRQHVRPYFAVYYNTVGCYQVRYFPCSDLLVSFHRTVSLVRSCTYDTDQLSLGGGGQSSVISHLNIPNWRHCPRIS